MYLKIINGINIAKEYSHQALLPEHVLFAFLEQQPSIVNDILNRLGIDLVDLKSKLKQFLISQQKVYADKKDVYASSRLTEVFGYANNFVRDFSDEYVSSEHLILGMAKEKNSFLYSYLSKQGLFADDLMKAIRELRGAQKADSQ